MPYNTFTNDDVEKKLGLRLQSQAFLPALTPVLPSAWLPETLARTLPLAKLAGSEKARSEFMIAPVLVELRKLLNDNISVFSGKEFNVDKDLGLNGVCDFLSSRSPDQIVLNAPVIALVEAKKGILEDGWYQCIAEMFAAQRFNAERGEPLEQVYGIVTNGSLWQFLQMQGNNVFLDPTEYSILPVEDLLAVLVWMLGQF